MKRFQLYTATALILISMVVISTKSPDEARTKAAAASINISPDHDALDTHVLPATYYRLIDDFSTTLTLNNKGPESIQALPTLFSLGGRRLDVPPITIPGTSFITVDLRDWVAEGAGFDEGNLQVTYFGMDRQLGGHLEIVDRKYSLVFDEEMLAMTAMSSRLEAVSWLPSHASDVTVAITNVTDSPLTATFSIQGVHPRQQSPLTIDLTARQTRMIDAEALAANGKGALREIISISIAHNGAPGSLLARGFVSEPSSGFSSSIEFCDPSMSVTSKLDGGGVRLALPGGEHLTPIAVARNIGRTESIISGSMSYVTEDGTRASVGLPEIRLSPGEFQSVDIARVIRANRIDSQRVASAGLEFSYSSAPGTVIVSAQSMSRDGNQVFRVPVVDAQAEPASAAGYPWLIDGNSSTFVYLKNVTEEPRQYTFQLRYEGGLYSPGLRTLQPNETISFDIRALRDGQVPDERGQTIPLQSTRGQVNWSIRGPQNHTLIGRSEQADFAHGISSTYACMNCCPDSFYGGWIDPGSVEHFVGDSNQLAAFESMVNCYGTVGAPFNPWPGWNSTDSNVEHCDPSGLATAQTPGIAWIQATWMSYEWGSFESGNPNECYERQRNVLAEALCEVLAGPDRLRVVTDSGQVALAACPPIIERRIIYEVIDAAGNPVNKTVNLREAFSNQTTNTCGNGQPLPSSCGPTNSAGQIQDTLSITCGGQAGAQNNPSCGFTQIQKIFTCLPNVVTELSFASHSIKANEVRVNNTLKFSSGIVLPK